MLSRSPPALLSAIRPSLRVARLSTPAAIHFRSQPKDLRSLPQQLSRSFHSTPTARKGIQPDSSDPEPPKGTSHRVAGAAVHVTEPSPLTNEQYYDYSEHYLNVIVGELEKAAEEGSDIEAEYSAGVMNISVPTVGTYVLNKQPPNKQIWLSSPVSGPKRYDWVVEGDRMDEKQESRDFVNGQWIYLRDGSNLTDLLNTELNVNLPKDVYSDYEGRL